MLWSKQVAVTDADTNAILRPSGDQLGTEIVPSCVLSNLSQVSLHRCSWRRFPSCQRAQRKDEKASLVPSGDQLGRPVNKIVLGKSDYVVAIAVHHIQSHV